MKLYHCPSCDGQVVWAAHPTGRHITVEPQPRPDGWLLLVTDDDTDRLGAIPVSAEQRDHLGAHPTLHRPHAAVCPARRRLEAAA